MRDDSDLNLRYAHLQQVMEHVKENNLFFLSSSFLKAQLKITFPEFSDITIEKKYPKKISLHAKTQDVVFKWIYTTKQTPDIQYFGYLTHAGLFFLHGPEEIFSVFDLDPKDTFVEPITQVMRPEEVDQIIESKKLLESIINRKVPKMNFFRKAQEIHFIDEKETEYRVFLKRDTFIQIKNLERVLQTRDIFRHNLAYVDLRIGRKVIYKKK